MTGQLKTIKKIRVEGKEYFITILLLKTSWDEWYCAYVYLDDSSLDDLSNQTYKDGNVYGIDTGHYFNAEQTLEEKFEDAIRQITELIESSFRSTK